MSVTPIKRAKRTRTDRPRPPADLLNHPDRLLTVDEWAGMVGLSTSYARARILSGLVPGALKQGKGWRIPLRAHSEYVRNLDSA